MRIVRDDNLDKVLLGEIKPWVEKPLRRQVREFIPFSCNGRGEREQVAK